jgi:predicted dehydrogenase
MAQVHAFIPSRIDPESGVSRLVGTPDSVQVVAVLRGGVRAVYRVSGVVRYGQCQGIRLYGTEGALHYDLASDRIFGTNLRSRVDKNTMEEISIPDEKAGGWRVEAEFVEAIRSGTPVHFTDFATGVSYMEFTEAVARSAQACEAITLPLSEFADSEQETPD